MKKIFYNIHNLIIIEVIVGTNCHTSRSIDALAAYRVDPINDIKPNIKFIIGPFKANLSEAYNFSHQSYVNENTLYSEGSIKKLNYKILYQFHDDSSVTLKLDSKIKGLKKKIIEYSVLQSIFLLPLLEYLFLKQKYLVIGGAGLSKDGNATLLLGRGGVFKTTYAMWFVREYSYDCLGDDKVIIGNDGNVLSFNIFPQIFKYRLDNLENEKISFFKKLNFYLNFKNFTKNFYKCECGISSLNNVIFLGRGTGDYSELSIDFDSGLKKIICNFILEISSSIGIGGYSSGKFHEMILAHRYVFPSGRFSNIESLSYEIAMKAFARFEFVELIGFEHLSPAFFHKILKKIV